jgi:ribose 5-phosphate isomerase B
MRVHIGTDHAGFDLKNFLVAELTKQGYEVVDHGPQSYDAEDDYPAFCIATGEAVVADPGSLAIVIGGSGNGEQIAANKVTGTRAALAYDDETARLAREHNDANVLSLGARLHTEEEALGLAKLFLETPFSGESRHARRIAQLAEYEKERV